MSHLPSDADLEALIEHAVRAPSVLNTQPWRFATGGGEVLLRADRSRQLAHLDPQGRELTISCGAALLYLRIAAHHAGWHAAVHPFPDGDPDVLARVSFSRTPHPDIDDRAFRALSTRRTNRYAFKADAIPLDVQAQLLVAVALEGATLHVFDSPEERDALAGLVSQGVLGQGEDADVRADLAAYLRPARDPRPDGVPDSAQSVWDRHALSRTTTASVADHKAGLVRDAPAVLVLATPGDAPPDWLRAGQALGRALLVAADRGLAASYANEPVEVEALRPRLSDLIESGVPQLVFRIGYPDEAPTTPRRRASDVTERLDPSTLS